MTVNAWFPPGHIPDVIPDVELPKKRLDQWAAAQAKRNP
jgi:hypothetical protein